MHLSVTCPQCSSKYQLDPSMRGKRMRCPNTICRAVFEVRDDNEPPPVKESPASSTPDANITTEAWQPPATAVKETTPVPAKKAPSAPKEATAEPKRPIPVRPKATPPPSDEFLDDFPGDDGTTTPTPAVETEAWQPETAPTPSIEVPPRRRRSALWIILSMTCGLIIVALVGYWRVRSGMESNETERFQHADELYQRRDFAEASAAFQKMQRDFSDSPDQKKYRFLGELSDVREAVHKSDSPDEAVKTLERVLQFASVYKGDPLLGERAADISESLQDLTKELTNLAEREKAPPLLAIAKRAWADAKKTAPHVDLSERERKHQDEWRRIELALADHFERQRIIAVLKKNCERATASTVEEGWLLVEKSKRTDDAEIRALLLELIKAHREQVTFTLADPSRKLPAVESDALHSLGVTPSLRADGAVKTSGHPIVALARGVLYALEPAKGELLWTRRVGIDTRVPPIRVPADSITPAFLIVLSSDQRSIAAVRADNGATMWQTALSGACVGTPVLVEQQVLVPTVAGTIDEIEIAEGRLTGNYSIGQPLTLGGVREPGSPFVYFPADEFCLYVIDIKQRACANILYARHPAGSLRGLPTIWNGAKGGWLLWAQRHGFGKTDLKPYRLPIKDYDQKPAAPIVQLASVSAAPRLDQHRLTLISETGMLSLFGVHEKGTRDPLLFPILPGNFAVDTGARRGPCEIAHADAENIWTAAHGKLQRVEYAFHPSRGPDALARWSDPVPLGHLLHEPDVRRDAEGHTILYVTTQASERAACLISAVDGESGKILWQRLLGILPEEQPRLVGGQIVFPVPDGILTLTPSPEILESPWKNAGDWLFQEPWTGAERRLLTNQNEVVRLSWLKGQAKARLRLAKVPTQEKTRVLDSTLPAAPQGEPVLGDGFVLVPLANGILVRISLNDGSVVNGPDWRAIGAEEQARGFLALVNNADFLLTDGSRGLQRLHSVDGKTWDKRAGTQVSHRIMAPPVVIAEGDKTKARVCIRDASDTLTLLDGERLTVLHTWLMPGKVTAGPFVRAGKIGCVVGKNRLIWIDPKESEPAWEYAFAADIVGEPHVIAGMLVVGDIAGQFVGLDPANGRPVGMELTLKANVAPTAAPLPFGEGHALAPLTDGTIVLLPLSKLRAKDD